MKRVHLPCSAGISTSVLASKVRGIANSRDLSIEAETFPGGEAGQVINEEHPDVVLLSPQVKYYHDETVEKYDDKDIPAQIINQTDYGIMNGGEVLKSTIKLVKSAE